MSNAGREPEPEPQIELRQIAAARNGDMWNIGWSVKNIGAHPLQILALLLPHSQFKSDESRITPAYDLKPRQEAEIQTLVRCDEPPGLVTENAFVIFQVVWLDERWRIFTRVRVTVDPDGKPQARTELITAQKVGFSKSNHNPY